ncbi:MAG: hypothetical protein DRO09_00480 [Thermoprotei archaeon]|nr:MAG: hypothetical protein DRO09_00480 [Thermoprotei archaeon]
MSEGVYDAFVVLANTFCKELKHLAFRLRKYVCHLLWLEEQGEIVFEDEVQKILENDIVVWAFAYLHGVNKEFFHFFRDAHRNFIFDYRDKRKWLTELLRNAAYMYILDVLEEEDEFAPRKFYDIEDKQRFLEVLTRDISAVSNTVARICEGAASLLEHVVNMLEPRVYQNDVAWFLCYNLENKRRFRKILMRARELFDDICLDGFMWSISGRYIEIVRGLTEKEVPEDAFLFTLY